MNPAIKANITSLGFYVPEKILSNKDLETYLETNDEWITSRTGIKERRIASEGETTSDMAVKAIEKLLSFRNIPASDIDLVIVATVTPDMLFPSTAALILEKLGVKHAWGFDLSGACSGFLYALTTGRSFIESGKVKKVIVVGADKMSAITDPYDRNTVILFGDGAGAVLLEPSEAFGIFDDIMYTDGSGGDYLYMKGGGSLHPATHETIDKKMHFIYQEGRTVYKFAVKGMQEVTAEILEKNHLKGDDIRLYIPHQANKRIIDATAERLSLREDQVFINIDKYANTTAATIPIGLCEAYETDRIRKGEYLLLAAFGAGFTWGSTLIKWGIDS